MDEKNHIEPPLAPEEQCAELLLRNRNMLLTRCARACKGHVDEANDLLQDIMLSVWQSWSTLRPGATDREKDAWLRAKSRTVIHDFLRKRKLKWASEENNTETETAGEDDIQKQREILDELIVCLNDAERELIDLYLNGYKYHEIAAIKQLKTATVKKRMERIHKKLSEYSKKINY
ncbi:MAG: RNA polymerase sigma factor [Bacteroidales bacterium]|nr:RNA polymerase sigma factor [Bacteroidales bacterium]